MRGHPTDAFLSGSGSRLFCGSGHDSRRLLRGLRSARSHGLARDNRGAELVVVGSEDPISTPAESEQIAKSILGARLAVVSGCGHLVPMEDPAAFAHQLGAFWR